MELLKGRKGFMSGSEIANKLGISRSMVHKIIELLRSKGYIIESHPRRGYKLLFVDDLSLAGTYLSYLDTRIKYSVHYVRSCTSTQGIAKSLAELGAPEGLVVIAEEMSQGRGRLGRKWYALKGGLWVSILLRPKYLRALQLLSLVSGLSVVKALSKMLSISDVKLKWPNDVLYDEKKLAGILVEGSVEADEVHYVIVGIGINVNNDVPKEIENLAISLKAMLGHEIPRVPLLRSLIKEFDTLYDELITGNTGKIINEWTRYSSTIGRKVKVITYGEVIEGIAKGLRSDGSLIVVDDYGKKRIVYAGDVIHLR